MAYAIITSESKLKKYTHKGYMVTAHLPIIKYFDSSKYDIDLRRVSVSLNLDNCLSVCLSVYLPVFLSVYLSVCLSVCLSV